jgi:hypothetical protein
MSRDREEDHVGSPGSKRTVVFGDDDDVEEEEARIRRKRVSQCLGERSV